jgi:squalene cyclase
VVLALVLLLAVDSDREVRAAVGRGVSWLKKQQSADGSFGSQPGQTALALLALRHSGVPARDRACKRAARNLDRLLPDGKTYSNSLGILALLEQSPERHKKKIRKLVARLVAGQCRNGQWSYSVRTGSRGDNSNTQLAILALAAARARGVIVPKRVFERLDRYLAESQNEDGGFGYSGGVRASYASMTAGGLMALALCRAAILGKPAHSLDDDPRIRRAVAWLDAEPVNRGAGRARTTKRKRRTDTFWRHYWLWSLERACGTLRLERLNGVDWYAKGAGFLVRTQRKDGSWRDPEESGTATCFALLFLARRTPVTLTPRDRDVAITPTR